MGQTGQGIGTSKGAQETHGKEVAQAYRESLLELGRSGVTNGESLQLHSEDINSRQRAEVRVHRNNAGKSRKQAGQQHHQMESPTTLHDMSRSTILSQQAQELGPVNI